MREEALPGNPNCVSFAAEATDVLAGRSWSEVLKMCAGIVGAFHEACALPVLVGLGWRVALDRKNRRHVQVTLWFQFDGPATSEHLDTLEHGVEHSAVYWSQGNIERVPVHGVQALYATGGRVHPLLVRTEAGLALRKLSYRERKVHPELVLVDEATPGDRWEDAEPIVGLPPPYGETERHLERMRLCLARHFSQRIIEADGVVRDDEADFMEQVFPDALMVRLGIDTDEARSEYLDAARRELPTVLGYHDKLGLIGLFFSACYSDGSLDAREMRVLKEAGETLGLTREEVVKYLRRFW